jgi:hypothetical protein
MKININFEKVIKKDKVAKIVKTEKINRNSLNALFLSSIPYNI